MIPRSYASSSGGGIAGMTGVAQGVERSPQQQVLDPTQEQQSMMNGTGGGDGWPTAQSIHPSTGHDNMLYQATHGYYEQQTHWQTAQEGQQQSQPSRSSPIAIIRAQHQENPHPAETDDDDDSVIDVELDARKLQKKYGDKVIAATYQGDALLSKPSVLKAPYLGSLSRSENYLSLPPISLDGEFQEPPLGIVGYGSLRDSHQRGRFLDGPSSYREPMSGQIRQLDNRVRYHGRLPPSMSIGERMQRSRKLKESREKEQQATSGSKTEPVATSSLSTIMNEVSTTGPAQDATANTNQTAGTNFDGKLPSETSGLTQHGYMKTGDDADNRGNFARPAMMSTSLTAFEVLMSANQAMPNGENPPVAVPAAAYGRAYPQYATGEATEMHSNHFQPLSRSMSDPTPHLHSPLLIPPASRNPPTLQLNPPLPPADWVPYSSQQPPPRVLEGNGLQQQQVHAMATNYQVPYNQQQSQMINGYVYVAADHDPDTHGAFDMDME